MLAKHYPELFADEPDMAIKADAFAAKCHELVELPRRRLGVTSGRRALRRASSPITIPARACANSACMSQPRKLLASVEGLQPRRARRTRDVCCGFGGTFAVKYGELSDAIVAQKSAKIAATGADTLLAGDLGCLMNMAGKLQREGRAVKVRHVAEVLAGMTDEPPIGEAAGGAKP